MPTVLQQGEAGVQVPALVRPPAKPLCAHPGSHPTPNTAPPVAQGWLTAPCLNIHGAAAGQSRCAGASLGVAS